jgi:hypothetical protein
MRRAASGGALDTHIAAGLPGDAIDLREAKSGALPDSFGREERLHRTGEHFGRHATAGIGDRDYDIATWT